MHRQCTPAAVAALVITTSVLAQIEPAEPATEPTITVLSQGASPRQVLRLAPASATTQDFELTIARRSIESDTTPQVPPMTWIFSTSVTKLGEGGDIHFDYRCDGVKVQDDPRIPPHILEAMRTGIQSVAGTGGRGLLSARAMSRSAKANIPRDLNPALVPYVRGMEDMFHQLATPLPREPIGIGAQWRSVNVLQLDGISVDQTIVFTLLESDGMTVKLDMQMNQTATDQKVQAAGQEITIKSLRTEGSGSVRRRLDQAFPNQASFKYVSEIVMAADAGGWEQEFRQKLEQTTKVEARQ